MENVPFGAVAAGGRNQTGFVPLRTSATGPRLTEMKVWTEVVWVFCRARAAWRVSFATTRTPRLRASGLAATDIAL